MSKAQWWSVEVKILNNWYSRKRGRGFAPNGKIDARHLFNNIKEECPTLEVRLMEYTCVECDI